jgi:septal ring-binding cell division protein DamX
MSVPFANKCLSFDKVADNFVFLTLFMSTIWLFLETAVSRIMEYGREKVSQQQKTPSAKTRSNRMGRVLVKLSGSIFSLFIGLSLISVMGAGLIASYNDRHSVAAEYTSAENFTAKKHLASGVSYQLPSRDEAKNFTTDQVQEKMVVPLPVEIEVLKPRPVLVEAVSKKEPQLVLAKAESIANRRILRDVERIAPAVTEVEVVSLQHEQPDLASISFDALLDERVHAGQPWMAKAEGGYSVQIMLVSQKTIGNMDKFVQEHGLEHFAEDLYLFPLEGKRYLIYYGRFDLAKTARVALSQLPSKIKKSGAFIIPLQKIRIKVARQQPKHKFVTSKYF